jgi:cupin fold WbuC family metalloprotein
MLVILRGRLGLVFLDETGAVTGKVVIAAGGTSIAANIPPGQFHGAVALAPSVVFEAKAGPYAPHLPAEKAAFAPEEGAPAAAEYLARLRRLFDGQ